MSKNRNYNGSKIKKSDHIFAVRVKTESNGLGVIKTFIILTCIALQLAFLIVSNIYFIQLFHSLFFVSLVITGITCVYILSSNYHGQAKATWILFLVASFSFGFVFFVLSDKRILFAKSRKRYNAIFKKTAKLQRNSQSITFQSNKSKNVSELLYNTGNFITYNDSETTYFPSGASYYDDMLEELNNAKNFIFLEYYIISNGVLLDRILKILEAKAKQGVDIRIIYDDMGSEGTFKKKTKKHLARLGIKLRSFNRLRPVLNIAMNLRNHRKIVIIDGKISYTGGANLADEYVNEKRMHGYWKDSGIKIIGNATDNFTIAFLSQWEYLTKENIEYDQYINLADSIPHAKYVTIPFVSGPNYQHSIAQNMYSTIISNATEKIYIMTPYFIPDETTMNQLIVKARAGVDVRIILPDIADKKFVYIVSRNNAEKLLDTGIKVYTMTSSFVHSKIVLTESSAIVGSINMDLRSYYQQFESAVFTDNINTLHSIEQDFDKTLSYCKSITNSDKKRNKLHFRILAGLFNIISPFM